MPGKVARSFRVAAACKVGGAGADHKPDRPYLPRNHAAVRQGADPDPEINVLFLQIDNSVRQAETHQHLWMSLEKRGRDRHDMTPAKDH